MIIVWQSISKGRLFWNNIKVTLKTLNIVEILNLLQIVAALSPWVSVQNNRGFGLISGHYITVNWRVLFLFFLASYIYDWEFFLQVSVDQPIGRMQYPGVAQGLYVATPSGFWLHFICWFLRTVATINCTI